MENIRHFDDNELLSSPKHFIKILYDKKFPAYLHDHNYYELVIVIQGKGQHQVGNSKFSVTRGDVFVIPPMIVHSFFDAENLEIINIILRTEFIKKEQDKSQNVPGYFALMEIEPFIRQNYDKSIFLHLNSLQLAEVQKDIKFIEHYSQLSPTDNFELQYHTTWKIIYYLSFLLNEQLNKLTKNNTAKYETKILDTLEYIHQNFSEKISIEKLAARVFLSRSTFLRSFQSICGCSPMRYLNQYRIKKAVELLDSSAMSKTEIAHISGFYDLSHMERCIKLNGSAAPI